MKSLLLLAFAVCAAAHAWPERPVKVLIPAAPGGSLDFAARVYADRLADRWNKPVAVENRPGADGILAAQALMASKDAHTLLLSFPGIVTVLPLLHDTLPFDPAVDLEPVSVVARDFLAIAVTPALPARSLRELVARAGAQALAWAASPGAPYLAFREFERRAGLPMLHVPYRAGTSSLPDLVSGRIHVAVLPIAAALPQARDGKVRLLAVTAAVRLPAASEVPTAAEAGYPELTIEAPLGVFAKKGTPAAIKERIAEDLRAIAAVAEVDARLRSLGMQAEAGTPTQYAETLRAQAAHWAHLARGEGRNPVIK